MTTSWTKLNKGSVVGWTNIPKPVGTSSVIANLFTGGQPIGLLLALTQSSFIGTSSIVTSLWTDVPKPTKPLWTNIPKAT